MPDAQRMTLADLESVLADVLDSLACAVELVDEESLHSSDARDLRVCRESLDRAHARLTAHRAAATPAPDAHLDAEYEARTDIGDGPWNEEA